MAVAVEDAGFILKDCIMWLYGSGFPKATDISKQLDKGHKREITKIVKRTGKEKGTYGAFEGNNKETAPTTPEAKLWNGWKSHGLKPAYEPILVCMKPNDGTYANNALKHGVSGLNIDGGRIEYKNEKDMEIAKNKSVVTEKRKPVVGNTYLKGNMRTNNFDENKGRFPANIILSESSAKLLDEQSGERISGGGKNGVRGGIFGDGKDNPDRAKSLYNDKGGASRFFYCAKASKAERNAGCEGLEEKRGGSLEGGADTRNNKVKTNQPLRHNNHPTVKPIALMEYLCKLTKTPTGGIVLDPFAGSGTTGLACQNTDRDFIGIEREEEYVKIAEARLKFNGKQEKLI